MPYKTQPQFDLPAGIKTIQSWNTFKLSPNLKKLTIITTLLWTSVKTIKFSSRMLEHELNSNNHHQGCLDMDQIPIIIIRDALTWIKPTR